jgi:hypothetical protein
MKVYLVPAGASRFALYSEAASVAGDDEPAGSRSLWARVRASFRRAVDEGEAAERGQDPDPSRGRVRRFVTRKLAEAVAEQRLLWHLRHEAGATLLHPDTLLPAKAVEITRAEFTADHRRHLRWFVIDTLLVVVTGPVFFFVPGPNLVSWYFTFRAVGHFFSLKGARRGLAPGFFTPEPNRELSLVAEALPLPDHERTSRVERAAAALGLDRLPAFVDRIADRQP